MKSALSLTKAFCAAMARKKPHDTFAALQEIFTEKELELAENRLRIALLLEEGLPYSKIQKELRVSAATVAAVSEQRKKKSFMIVIELVDKELHRFRWWKGKHA